MQSLHSHDQPDIDTTTSLCPLYRIFLFAAPPDASWLPSLPLNVLFRASVRISLHRRWVRVRCQPMVVSRRSLLCEAEKVSLGRSKVDFGHTNVAETPGYPTKRFVFGRPDTRTNALIFYRALRPVDHHAARVPWQESGRFDDAGTMV